MAAVLLEWQSKQLPCVAEQNEIQYILYSILKVSSVRDVLMSSANVLPRFIELLTSPRFRGCSLTRLLIEVKGYGLSLINVRMPLRYHINGIGISGGQYHRTCCDWILSGLFARTICLALLYRRTIAASVASCIIELEALLVSSQAAMWNNRSRC